MPNIKSYTTKKGETYYQFQMYIGTDEITGRRIKTTRRGFKTKKEAKEAYAKLQLNIDRVDTSKKERILTYKEVYNLWFEQYQNTVKESTLVKTEENFRIHILPILGNYKIDKINIHLCQKAVNQWFNDLKRFEKVYAYAKKILEYAIKLEKIEKNPMTLVTLPKRLSFSEDIIDKNFYTKEELTEFLACLEQESNKKAYTLFRLLAFTGMRKSEALSLTWKDINFETFELNINKTLAKGKEQKLIVQTPKTRSSVRKIMLDEATVEILKNWQSIQKNELQITNQKLNPNNKQLVFSNAENDFLQLGKTTKWINQIQSKYNLKKITTHGLRHTHCSLLFEAGINVEVVKDRLGHSDIKTTMNIYTHVSEKSKEKTANQFGHFMGF